MLNAIYPSPNQPCLITEDMVKTMKKGSVIMDIVDVGVIESVHYTTLADPIYFKHGVLRYNVANMPALCPKTSTQALLVVTGKYISSIANHGLKGAFERDSALMKSICTLNGKVVDSEVAANHGVDCTPFNLSMLK